MAEGYTIPSGLLRQIEPLKKEFQAFKAYTDERLKKMQQELAELRIQLLKAKGVK